MHDGLMQTALGLLPLECITLRVLVALGISFSNFGIRYFHKVLKKSAMRIID